MNASADEELLAELRPASFAIAYRMLGSVAEAEDVVGVDEAEHPRGMDQDRPGDVTRVEEGVGPLGTGERQVRGGGHAAADEALLPVDLGEGVEQEHLRVVGQVGEEGGIVAEEQRERGFGHGLARP